MKQLPGHLRFKRGGNGWRWVLKNVWPFFTSHNLFSGHIYIPLTWNTYSFSSKTTQVSAHDGLGSNSRVLSLKSGPGMDEAIWMWSFEYGSSWSEDLWIKEFGYLSFKYTQHTIEMHRSDNYNRYYIGKMHAYSSCSGTTILKSSRNMLLAPSLGPGFTLW